ncbi:ExeA family protein [Streptomyces malaysiensis]|uniref:ExeA family protein n=1 Tax=Streptomyces malaysiensis TaxID=92644 RepID=UPI00371CE187
MPFGKDLAPSMLHRHSSHAQAVARITWCIGERALGVITGEVGAGKTVAVRASLSQLDHPRHKVIYMANPAVGVAGIHHAIVTSLGGVPRPHKSTLIPQATDLLATENNERGRVPILIIEEAHLLDHEQLEAIRMLTNDEMDSSSPLACLLIGQPTLRHKIKLGVLAALDQRIQVRYNMPSMTGEETASYLVHHLALAGRSDTLFTDDAITLIHDPRLSPRRQQPRRPGPAVRLRRRRSPSSTRPAHAPPSPKLPPNDDRAHPGHHQHPSDPMKIKQPAGTPPAGSLHPRTSPSGVANPSRF